MTPGEENASKPVAAIPTGDRVRLAAQGRWLESFPVSRRFKVLAAVVIVVLYLGAVHGQWWPTPDSALYLGQGWTLAETGRLEFNGEVAVEVSPGFPAILALLRWMFGRTFWAPNFFAAFCGLGTLWLTYRCIAILSDERLGLMVTIATASSFLFFFNAHRILTDMPFALCFWGVLYAVLRFQQGRWPWGVAIGVFSLSAIVIRVPGVIAMACLAVGVALDRSRHTRKGRRLAAAATILVTQVLAAGAMEILARSFSGRTPPYLDITLKAGKDLARLPLRLGPGLIKFLETISELLDSQQIHFPIGVLCVGLLAVGSVFAWRGGRRMAPFTIWAYLAVLVLLIGATAVKTRFFVPLQGLYFLVLFEGLLVLVRWVERRRGRDRPRVFLYTVYILTAFVILTNAPKLLRLAVYYNYLSYTPRFYEKIDHGNFREFPRLARLILTETHPGEPVGVTSDIRYFHFLSGRKIEPIFTGSAKNHAKQVDQFIRNRPDVRLFLVQQERKSERLEELNRHLEGLTKQGVLERIYAGRDFHAYRRPEGGTTRTAASVPTSPTDSAEASQL
jgi:hypothetical protein